MLRMNLKPGSLIGLVALCAQLFVQVGCTKKAKLGRALESADTYFQAQEYDKARIAYLQALQIDGSNPQAIERLGLVWSQQGSPLKAVPFLNETLKVDPSNREVRAQFANAVLSMGDVTRARSEAIALLGQDPGNEQALLILGQTSQTEAEVAEAEAFFNAPAASAQPASRLARANILLRHNKLAEAEASIGEALKAAPDSSTAHLAQGGILLIKKDLENASLELKRGSAAAPLRSIGRLKYAEFLGQSGKVDEGLTELGAVNTEAPDYLPAWIVRARLLSSKGDYDEALKTLENVFSRDNENYDARVVAAQTLLAKGDGAKAVESLERLDQKMPNVGPTQLLLAQAYLATSDRAKAIGILEKAVESHPEFTEAATLLGQLQLQSGNPDAAIRTLQALLEARPNLAAAQLFLATALQAAGRLDEALAMAQNLEKTVPNAFEPQFLIGVIHQQKGEIDQARAAFERAILVKPDYMPAVAQLVMLDVGLKDFDAAKKRADAFAEKNSASPAAHFLVGRVHASAGEWEQAETALSRALEIDPAFAPAYGLFSEALVANNRARETLDRMDAVLEKSPDNARALMMKGMVNEKLQDFAAAKDAYVKLLAVAPDHVPALNNLAYIKAVKFQKFDEAQKLAEHARELQPGDESVADTLGWIYFLNGDFARALPLVQEAAAKLSDNPEVQFHLGMTSSAMGHKDIARGAFEQALKSTEPFPGKEESERRLASLKAGQDGETSASSAELAAQVAAQPTDLVLKLRLAAAYEKEGESSKAVEIYTGALAQNPALPAAAARLATIYLDSLNQPQAALDWAKKARALAPSNPEVAIILGRAAMRNHDAVQAYSLLRDTTRGAGPEALFDFAHAAYAIGRETEAVEILQKLISEAPDSPVVAKAKTFSGLAAAGEQPTAIEGAMAKQAEQASVDYPDLLAAKFVVARSLSEQSKPGDAIPILEEVVSDYPEFFAAQRELARIYAGMPDKLDRAYELASKARKASPEDSQSARVLAAICFGRKDFAQTRQLLESMDKPDSPLEAGDLFYLGMAQFELKEPAKSRETLQRALDAKLGEPQAIEARKTIEAVKKTNAVPGG